MRLLLYYAPDLVRNCFEIKLTYGNFYKKIALGSTIPSKEILEIFKLLEWKQIKFNSIFKVMSIKKFHGFEEVKKFLESELTKKIRDFKGEFF